MNKLWGHFRTITKHKIGVGILCCKCGIPYLGFMHDWSKYSWVEFSSGVKYFQGNRSPIDREKEVLGYASGWLHHKGRNRHHWEYWIDLDREGKLMGSPIPNKYIVEMFCDRVVASAIYNPKDTSRKGALNYFLAGEKRYIMDEKSKELLYTLLKKYADEGLDVTRNFIKKEVLK